MSWLNPSESEAADEYYAAKSRCNNAVYQKRASERAEAQCKRERSQLKSQIRECKSQKLNFEKRIKDIEKIVNSLTGNGSGYWGTDVPEDISKYDKSLSDTDESYKEAIKCNDKAAASIATSFNCKSVENESDSASALQKYRDEIARLQKAIEELKAQMNQFEQTVDELSAKISSYNAEQMSWNKVIRSSSFDMVHYRAYM